MTQHNRVAVGRGIRRSFIHRSRLLPRRLLDFLGRQSQQSSFLTHSEEESEKGEKRKRGIFFLMLWTASVSVYVCVGSRGIARIKIKAHIQSMCCCCCCCKRPFHTLFCSFRGCCDPDADSCRSWKSHRRVARRHSRRWDRLHTHAECSANKRSKVRSIHPPAVRTM